MSSLRACCIGATLAVLGTTALGAAPFPVSPTERARAFAECAGRYAAIADHDRLMKGQTNAAAEARRDAFSGLLDAVLPDAVAYGMPVAKSREWHSTARAAHIQLLAAAAYSFRESEASRAELAAAFHVSLCDRLILGA
ncbi:MAG: hypothetical protein AAFR35_04400 [Pseudomonadota bacterium]